MRWWFIKLSENDSMIEYAYSRETKICDGRIVYSKADDMALMAKPSETDRGSKRLETQSLSHFYGQVVNESFPDERYVCCG